MPTPTRSSSNVSTSVACAAGKLSAAAAAGGWVRVLGIGTGVEWSGVIERPIGQTGVGDVGGF